MNTKEISKELIAFMASKFAQRTIWINKEIEVPDVTFGYEFRKSDLVKGVLVRGEQYPFDGMDVSLEDHMKILEVIKSSHVFGSLMSHVSEPEGPFMYYDLEINELKPLM